MRKCLVIALFVSLWGCGKSVKVDPPAMDEPDRVLYEKALNLMAKHNYPLAQVTLQTFISTYQDSDYFPKAKYALAESYYREGGRENLDSAEAAFKDYIIYFRDSDLADDAQMMVAMTHVRRVQSADRDNTEARLAELELKEMIASYPNSDLLEEAKQKLRDVIEILAEGSFNIANQYFLRKNYKAAVDRYEEIQEKWPDFSKMADTLYFNAESLRLAKNAEASGTLYAEVVADFPASPKAKLAKQRLIELNLPVPAPNPLAVPRPVQQSDKNLLGKTVGVFKSHPTVPLSTSAASVQEVKREEELSPARANMGLTILLADDSPTIQRLVLQTFADTSFDVVCVNNGDAAIRKFEEMHPDVVLADIYMPGKDGFEVCAYVRSHSTHARTPVILLVGAFDAFDEVVAMQAGAAAHITKPFEPQALIDLVIAVSISAREPQPESRVEPPPPPSWEATTSDEAMPVFSEPVVPVPAGEIQVHSRADTNDLLGLHQLFQPEVVTVSAGVSSELSAAQIDTIVDRVLQKLSARVVESIAWDVVPDIAAKIVREELKRTTHEG